MNVAFIEVDASTNRNPGDMRIGYIIRTAHGKVAARVGQFVGQGTINIAEYLALIGAMRHAFRLGFRTLYIQTDAQLISRQLAGRYKVKDRTMRKLFREVKDLILSFEKVSIRWVGRDANTSADELTRQTVFEEADLGEIDQTGAVAPKARSMHPWQAALVRQSRSSDYALGRIFGQLATNIRQIRRGVTYKAANLDLLPRWDDPNYAFSLVSAEYPAPQPVFNPEVARDPSEEAATEARIEALQVDVREGLPDGAGPAAEKRVVGSV